MMAAARQRTPERDARDTATIPVIASDTSRTGRRIGGRYSLLHPLRGQSDVWLAEDRDTGPCVLKTGSRERVAHELGVLGELHHPHIVRVLDSIEAEGRLWIVLERLGGGDLVSLAGLDPVHWLGAALELAGALAFLHESEIVHRDVKARNVMLDAGGCVRLIDFGSAAGVGSPWTAAGTTAEAVPRGRAPGAVASGDDVYAFAALLFELMHGAPPGAPGRRATGVPAALAALVENRLAARDPASGADLERFSTVIESLLEPQST